jgi:hypothetical protein
MTLANRGVAAARKLQRWFKRRVLQQPWMMEEFASPILQESLLLDKARCDAYREAIHRTVKPGDVVVERPFLQPASQPAHSEASIPIENTSLAGTCCG